MQLGDYKIVLYRQENGSWVASSARNRLDDLNFRRDSGDWYERS